MTPYLPDLSTVGIGAAFAALAAGWAQVKNVLGHLIGVLVITVEFAPGHAGISAKAYCQHKLRSTATAFRHYVGYSLFIRPESRYGCVMYEQIGGAGRLFWRGRVPLWIGLKASKDGNALPSDNDQVIFRFIRGTFDPDKLAREVASFSRANHDRSTHSFRVIRLAGTSAKKVKGESIEGKSASPNSSQSPEHGRLVGWTDDEIGENHKTATDPVKRLALSRDVENVVGDIERWFKSETWYAARQIPWRFGALFYGKPGTGKSSLAKALAQKLNIPIVLMDISTMDNQEFHGAYQTALGYAPAMVLIEDIDAVFHGRENVAAEKGSGVTFDCFLNTISGVENSDGVLLVVTTNNLDKVDQALGVPEPGSVSSRPGRIDRAVELPALNHEGRVKIARRILAGCHDSWIDYLVKLGATDTGAQFEDRCATVALGLYWSADTQRPAPDFEPERLEIAACA